MDRMVIFEHVTSSASYGVHLQLPGEAGTLLVLELACVTPHSFVRFCNIVSLKS